MLSPFSTVRQALKAGDLITWDPNGNGYYIKPKNRWYVEAGRYDEKGAGGGLGQWDRDHHYDVWGKVCAPCIRAAGCASCVMVFRGRGKRSSGGKRRAAFGEARAVFLARPYREAWPCICV